MSPSQRKAPSPRRRAAAVGAAVVSAVLLTGAQSSCELRTESHTNSSSQARSGTTITGSSSRVHYKVSSDANIKSVTYIDSDGKRITRTDVGRSWFGTGTASGGVVMVSATTGTGGSTISCTMSMSGKVVQRATAMGGASTTVVCKASP